SRAREMLRSRLTRRGLAISATFLATRLSQNTVFAEVVPQRLIEMTSYNALAFTHGGHAGAALVSSDVLDLAEDALNAPVNLPTAFRTPATDRIEVTAILAGADADSAPSWVADHHSPWCRQTNPSAARASRVIWGTTSSNPRSGPARAWNISKLISAQRTSTV